MIEDLLGVPRISMLLKAQRSVVIGKFLFLSFLPLKKPSHRIFLRAAHHILHSKWT
jgi:hypothetical protein